MFDKFKKGIFSKGSQAESPIKIGDSVKVKEGVSDPDDMDYSLAGWQGWVVEVFDAIVNEDNKDTLQFMIAWDSVTLMNIPRARLIELEREGYDWTMMCLDASDVDIVTPRDNIEDAETLIESLSDSIYWEGMGEEGERIVEILGNASSEVEAYQTWGIYLKKELVLPFQAVYYSDNNSEIPDNAIVEVLQIDHIKEENGIIVKVCYENQTHEVALSDIAVDEEDKNFNALDLYGTWVTNKKDAEE